MPGLDLGQTKIVKTPEDQKWKSKSAEPARPARPITVQPESPPEFVALEPGQAGALPLEGGSFPWGAVIALVIIMLMGAVFGLWKAGNLPWQ